MKLSHRIVSWIIDAGLGAYIALMLLRIILPAMIGYDAGTVGMVDMVIVITCAVFLSTIGIISKASLGQAFFMGSFPKGRDGTLTKHIGWLALTVSILGGWIITDISPVEFLSAKGLDGAARIFTALATPNFDIIGEALQAMVVTIFTALMATIAAVPIAFLLGFPAARNIMNTSATERAVYTILRAVLNVARSMEPIIWAIIFSVWVGIGPFAGMLALVVHTIASLAKQYSEQIEDVDDGPIEAISATGATRIQVLWFAIVPQCVIPFLSFTIYRWDINVRMATIIGFVGGGGIGTLLTQYQGLSKFHEVGTLIIIITLIVWLLDVTSARIREALK